MAPKRSTGTANGSNEKPSVLIIGGLGYIGRFLAKYIHDNNLASSIRLVDKVLPQLADLAPEFTTSCSPENFLQADASREGSMSRIFDHPKGSNAVWDYVFNLGGETAWSQTYELYKLGSYQLSLTLGKEAAKRGVKSYVEVSTGAVYAPNRTPRTEQDKTKPWLNSAVVNLEAEQELAKMPGLNLVILRLAHVFGEYDSGIISKALCLARVYQKQQKELRWLWNEDLRINTVHISDVVRALWTAAHWRENNTSVPTSALRSNRKTTSSSKVDGATLENIPIFNIVDHGQSSQGTLARVIGEVFDIKTGFQGTLISQFAKMNLEHVVDDLNEDILQPWADMLAAKAITRPGPLSPFLEKELLKDTDLSLDGSLFEKTTGFKYNKPEGLTSDGVRDIVKSYEKMGWWP